MGNVESVAKPQIPGEKLALGTLGYQNSHRKSPCSQGRAWQLLPSGLVGKTADYTVTGNVMRRVHDFVQFDRLQSRSEKLSSLLGVERVMNGLLKMIVAVATISIALGVWTACSQEDTEPTPFTAPTTVPTAATTSSPVSLVPPTATPTAAPIETAPAPRTKTSPAISLTSRDPQGGSLRLIRNYLKTVEAERERDKPVRLG